VVRLVVRLWCRDGHKTCYASGELSLVKCTVQDAFRKIVHLEVLFVLCPSLYWRRLAGRTAGVCPSLSGLMICL